MKGQQVKRLELEVRELRAILQQARSRPIDEKEYSQLGAVLDTVLFVTSELVKKGASVRRLRKLLFGARTEKTSNVVGTQSADGRSEPAGPAGAAGNKKKRKGHGRNPAAAYTGAEKVKSEHPTLKPADVCPKCDKGKLYQLSAPAVLVLLKGQAPITATVHEATRLRCNLCGEVFTAPQPAGVGASKYDVSAPVMIGLLKYGTGFPFNRLDKLQAGLGIPLPATTQWDLVHRAAKTMAPAFEELIRQGAQGQVLHNDDTTAKILALMRQQQQVAEEATSQDGAKRTGVFTSGIVSIAKGRRTALFFTGRQHAGENLADVLARRASELAAPIQMCDALSRNAPGQFETILANCLAHSRRRFVDVTESFPDECRHVLEELRKIYDNDATARKQQMSPQQRLRFHKRESGPTMKSLKKWLSEQLDHKRVEPNSGLGEAIRYMLKHYKKLTLFLRAPGAPIDNNVAERALKKVILHRKNALFFRTLNGAWVGDLYMSLIHTCELNAANPFDYLVALLHHAEQVRASPADWMPWNCQQTLDSLATAA